MTMRRLLYCLLLTIVVGVLTVAVAVGQTAASHQYLTASAAAVDPNSVPVPITSNTPIQLGLVVVVIGLFT